MDSSNYWKHGIPPLNHPIFNQLMVTADLTHTKHTPTTRQTLEGHICFSSENPSPSPPPFPTHRPATFPHPASCWGGMFGCVGHAITSRVHDVATNNRKLSIQARGFCRECICNTLCRGRCNSLLPRTWFVEMWLLASKPDVSLHALRQPFLSPSLSLSLSLRLVLFGCIFVASLVSISSYIPHTFTTVLPRTTYHTYHHLA